MTVRSFVAIVIALGLVAGCGRSDDRNESSASSARPLRLQVAGDREETAVFETIARAYESRNREVRVTVDVVPEEEDHLAKLATGFASGSVADAFVVNYRAYAQFVARGAIDAAGPRLAADGFDLTGYAEAPLKAFTQGGTLQCMPLNASSMVVYVNRTLFERAGVSMPDGGWDWDAFRSAAKALTAGDVKGVGIDGRLVRVAPFVWSGGGQIVDDQRRPTTTTFDSEPGRRALAFLAALVHEDGVVPTAAEVKAISSVQRFAEGRVAMFLSSRRDVPRFREVEGLDFDVASPPRAPGGSSVTILHGDGMCVSKGTGREVEAAALAAFFASQQGQQIGALSGRIVPVAPSARGAFLQPGTKPGSSQVFLDQLPTARAVPAVPGWNEVEDAADDVLTKLFSDADYGFAEAARDIDAASKKPLAEAGR